MKRFLTILILTYSCMAAVGQTYQVGDLYTAPDGSQGVVYFLHPDGSGGWVVALNDASSGCAWGDATDVVGLDNQNASSVSLMTDTSGYANTQAIRLHQNNNTNYAAGKVDFAHGWCLPSPAQLRLLSAQWPRISSAMTSAGGSGLSSATYWTSAEYSSSQAWAYYFGPQNSLSGGSTKVSKNNSNRVRAVRSFTYESSVELSYEWSTGDTTPSITVSPEETTTYTVTVTVTGGYTDTVETTIVVNSNPTTEFTIIASGPYTWNGVTYSQSGNYTRTFTSVAGCDSVVVLHLTVSIVPEVTIVATDDTICAGDEVTLEAVLTNAEYILQIPPIAAGDILCTDNTIVKPSDWPVQGKTAMGVVFYVDNTGEHGWAMHLQNQGTNMIWGNQGDIQTLTNYPEGRTALQDYDGQSNTQKIRNKGGSSTYPSAWAVDFANGWYLPSIGQLAVFVSELETVDATLALLGATTFPPDEYFRMWSSTESGSAHAWCIQGTGEIENHVYKNITSTHFIVRSVRSF